MRLTYIAITLIWALSFSVRADYIGDVIKIADGDSVTILDSHKVQHKVRLVGIDAPERKQPFGKRSKQSLSDLVYRKMVTVKSNKHDQYGRELGKILINGVDVNLEQIRRGMAWYYKVYKYDLSASDRRTYAKTERKARMMQYGLCIDSAPLPPWIWRKLKRKH